MAVFLPIPLLVMGMIAGATLFLVGFRKGDDRLRGWGETIFGLSMSILALVLLVDMASVSSEHPESRTWEMAMLLIISLVGAILAALGFRQLLASYSENGRGAG